MNIHRVLTLRKIVSKRVWILKSEEELVSSIDKCRYLNINIAIILNRSELINYHYDVYIFTFMVILIHEDQTKEIFT